MSGESKAQDERCTAWWSLDHFLTHHAGNAENTRNGLKLLSMGMSADFATAIAFGATHVRVGTAIFGGRAGHGPAGQKKSPDAGLGG